ncbi:MAG: septal ring lytic transglycosylase RlpA family protein [Pseudomonadota bacterium]|nr:septal ring lytic transglycosylase RlpA family protein [Pseudomonadota bacterium]
MALWLRIFHSSIYLVIIWLLASCGGHTTRVIDTPETRELAGWQKPYEVDGQRYHPLRDHHGFQQRGIASWYGRKFHGRKTSNGEVYDMYGTSAAHKTLPMGVYVRVTHLTSGRHVVVRVNDRGPFVAGRIIDLSYGAAKQLGIVDSGTAQVHIQALGYRQTDLRRDSSRVNRSYDSGSFAVQVGAFSTAENAHRLVAKMQRRYGKAVISTGMVNNRQVYRVRIGDFSSLRQAEATVHDFVSQGFSGSFVVAFD